MQFAHLTTAALVTLVLAPAAFAQQPLEVGEMISGTIVDGAPAAYTIELEPGRFVTGRAMQRGVDVVVEIEGPDGTSLGSFDSPNGNAGPEPFHFHAETSGTYRVTLRPFVNGAGGDYDVTLLRDEARATDAGGRVRQMLWQYDSTTPGGVVAVTRGGATVFEHAFGMANLTHDVPFSLDTPTNIGSVTKQFTAFAILLLADAGRLSLDDDIRAHIPELPDLGQTVTIRHLLSHTSGYREVLNTVALGGRRIDQGDYIDETESIEVVQRQQALQNPPGSEHNYNNTGYELLGTVIARVSGRPAGEWMDLNVFRPLGMHGTRIRETAGEIIPGSAQGYTPTPGGFAEVQDLGATGGAGGIYTTARDLGRWVANLRTGAVGGPDLLARMTDRYVLTDGDTTDYAMGLVVRDWRGQRIVEHGGADAAHRAMLVYLPAIDASVVALSNHASFNAGAVAFEMIEQFFGEYLADTPSQSASVDYDPAAFDEFAGSYELDIAPGFVLTLSRDGDRLLVQATGQPAVDLRATSDTTFSIPLVGASITMHRDAGGGASTLTLHQNGDNLARRISAAGTEAAATLDLATYVGTYYSAELDARYELALNEDGALTLRHRRFGPIPLTHRSEDGFSGPGFPVSDVSFERDGAGRVTGLRAGNGRTRGVWFGRVE